ncbi:MAG: cation:proton antiporter [Acidobacteriota bacterium]|nr:cation:proton antiporter [Acidobacteriota bacterium]
MSEYSVLIELVILLAASVVVILFCHRLRLPSVAGFVLTGVLIGPSGLRLIRSDEAIHLLAEIGIVMLLFMVGLEFSLKRLRPIRRYFLWGGLLQTGLTSIAAAAALLAIGAAPGPAVLGGFLASLSSTAVVLNILSDRREVDAPHGRAALGILLFQDLAFVPMLAVIPLLAGGGGDASLIGLAGRFGLSLAEITAGFLAARLIVPRLLDLIVRTRIREIFILTSLLICLGMALFTSRLGLSLALGAFLAGLIIAESSYSHQVVSDILPFKIVFNSLFFISIGLMLDLRTLGDLALPALGLAAAIIVLKTATGFLAVWPIGRSPRVAFTAGLNLAQIGEFSFVLAGAGLTVGLLPERYFQAFLAASVLTLLLAPVLTEIRSRRAAGAEIRPGEGGEESYGGLKNHVIIAGYGLNGRNLARVLKAVGVPYIVLDLNPETMAEALAAGEPFLFGDVSGSAILKQAGIASAKMIVFAISDPACTRRGVRIARHGASRIRIIVRTRYATEIDELYALGADAVVPEEFETSIEIFSRVLEEFHIPRNVVDAQVKVIRGERYGVLREVRPVRPSMENIADLLNAGTAETFYLGHACPAAERTLRDLDLRNATGATIIAVVRGEESFASPAADFKLQEGDTLVLMASHAAMDAAFAYLGSCAVRKS